jgi:hypothetical protein
MENSSIYAVGQSVTINDIATGTLWTRVTQFTNAGPSMSLRPDIGVDELDIQKDGIYFAFFAVDFVASENTRLEFAIMENDLPTYIRAGRGTLATGTVDTRAYGGTIDFDAGDRVTLGVQSEITGTFITVRNASLVAFRLDR